MEQILIACGDVDLLRKIAGDLPEGRFKPIATKTGSGIVDKIRGRDVAIAIVHSSLADVAAGAPARRTRTADQETPNNPRARPGLARSTPPAPDGAAVTDAGPPPALRPWAARGSAPALGLDDQDAVLGAGAVAGRGLGGAQDLDAPDVPGVERA